MLRAISASSRGVARRPLSPSFTMAENAVMSLATLGEQVRVDLWNYQSKDGRSIRRAIDFLTPFALREKPWPYPQLGGWSPEGFPALARRAGLKFREPKYASLARRVAGLRENERAVLLLPGPKPVD